MNNTQFTFFKPQNLLSYHLRITLAREMFAQEHFDIKWNSQGRNTFIEKLKCLEKN